MKSGTIKNARKLDTRRRAGVIGNTGLGIDGLGLLDSALDFSVNGEGEGLRLPVNLMTSHKK